MIREKDAWDEWDEMEEYGPMDLEDQLDAALDQAFPPIKAAKP